MNQPEIAVQYELIVFESLMHNHGIPFRMAEQLVRRQLLIGALERAKWVISKAANEIGLHRNTVNELMAELNIKQPAQREEPLSRPERA